MELMELRDEELRVFSVCARSSTVDSESEVELVDVADTLTRAISERMMVRSTVTYLQTVFVFCFIEGHS